MGVEATRMANNLTELIITSSGVLENASTTCIVEKTQVIGQCNEYLAYVMIVGIIIGVVACGIGVLIGSWYRGRQSINK